MESGHRHIVAETRRCSERFELPTFWFVGSHGQIQMADPSIIDLETLFAGACSRFRCLQVSALFLSCALRRQFVLRNKFNDSATIPNCRQ